MGKSNITSIALSLISVGVTVIASVNEQYRIPILIVFTLFIAAYFVSIIYNEIDKNSKEIKRTKEKLKIYEHLMDIKSDIKSLKKEVFKK